MTAPEGEDKVAGALHRAADGTCGHVKRWPGAIQTECGRPAGHGGLHRVHGWAWPQETASPATGGREPELPAIPMPIAPQRADVLRRIGELWRGDWSGHVFDGRDGQRWIEIALSGGTAELTELLQYLQRIENEW